MKDLLLYADARLGESGTWASIAAALVALHLKIDPGLMAEITNWGIAGAVALGIALKERGTKSASAVATDALAAAAGSITVKTTLPVGLALLLPFGLLAGCDTTPPQQQALVTTAVTFASFAASKSTTVADLLQKGVTLCGKTVSPEGVLIGDGIKLAATLAGLPTIVTGQPADAVADTCKALDLLPGAAPPGLDPAQVPVVPVLTTLPSVT